jgi:hypothetical protein
MKTVFLEIITLTFFSILPICAQESLNISDVSPMAEGTYKMKINGKSFRAIPEETMKKLLKLEVELNAAKTQNVLKDSLIDSYENTRFWYSKTLNEQRNYTEELESVLQGYKGLISDYKKLSEPWLSVSAALGASGENTKPAVLFGLEFSRLQFWGIFQERNSGILLGTKMILF